MKRKSRFSEIVLLCGTVMLASPARADEGIPALLQFADEWQQRRQSVPKNVNEKRQQTSPQNGLSVLRDLRQDVQERDRKLSQQAAMLREQAQEIARLQLSLKEQAVKKEIPETLPEMSLFRQMVVSVRQALGGTPQEKEAAARIAVLKTELTHSQDVLKTAQTQVHTLTSQFDEQAQLLQEKEAELVRAQEQNARSQESFVQLQTKRPEVVNAEELDSPERQLSYAAGSALGADLLSVVEEREASGITLERPVLLAGVTDMFLGQTVLSPDTLKQLLADAEKTMANSREQRITEGVKQDKVYVDAFKKRENVKRSPSGFWYHVDYVGDSAIPDDAIVDIVVKEMLTDGRVIQDMDATHKVMSQPLSDYPPLFKEAMGFLKNHGSMTLVVPPELAYGEQGYPPYVLPGATMVYTLRINDVTSPSDKSSSGT